jgi:cation transport ATPase
MKKVLFLFAVGLFAAAGVAQAETWRGVIGDSMCAAKHSEEKGSDHSKCVAKCIQGGSAYVLVAKDKVYKIANQDFADLKAHAGHVVMLSGDVKDDTITVTKVEMPTPEKK